jgi:hypothetical protein
MSAKRTGKVSCQMGIMFFPPVKVGVEAAFTLVIPDFARRGKPPSQDGATLSGRGAALSGCGGLIIGRRLC